MNINSNTNSRHNHLTEEQLLILNIYVNQYNQIFRQINYLYSELNDIRNNIHSLTNTNSNSNTNFRDNINSNSNFRDNNNTNSNFRDNNNINTYRMRRRPRFNNNIFDTLFGLGNSERIIHYDYNQPINPNTYLQTNISENINNNLNNNLNNNIASLFNSFLNTNVVIRPTQEQINNASTVVSYGSIQNPQNDTCPISLDNFQPNDLVRKIHHCGHIFNQSSFNQWFNNSVRCPICRYDIRDYQSNNNNSNNNNDNILDSIDIDTETNNETENETENENKNETENENKNETENENKNETENENERINFRNNRITRNHNGLRQNLFNIFSDRLFENMFSTAFNINNNEEHLYYDPSNNIIVYETSFTQ
jgi:hypothetical protein